LPESSFHACPDHPPASADTVVIALTAVGPGANTRSIQLVPPAECASFEGYVRADAQAGTRNSIGIIASVNCPATAARQIANNFRGAAMAEWSNVDGVLALTHGSGCGTGATGEMADTLRRTIAGYARHANFYAVLLAGLGCEVNQIDVLLKIQPVQESALLRSLVIQDLGDSARTVRQGIEIVREMLAAANTLQYGEAVAGPGLVFKGTSGYDPVLAAGQVAGGCNLICFSTGRGQFLAASRHPASNRPPIPRCPSGWRRTWTSIADLSYGARQVWPRSADKFLILQS
jgi:altronate dehydratase